MLRFFARSILCLACALAMFQSQAVVAAPPNIIVILADDMGFSDLGCYGSEIPTPNLDKLAAGGLRFTQCYNTARCCPTRAALLTGLYSHQAGVGHMIDDRGTAGYRGRLNDRCVTLAEALRPAGYFTAMCGKWHVGQNHGVTPWGRGFERSLSAAVGAFYFPASPRTDLFFNGRHVGRNDDPLPKDWYSPDLLTQFSLNFIDEAKAANKPFFLYLAHNAPHFPLQAPPEDIARFRGRYKAGWDKLREQRHASQIRMGIVDKQWPLAPRPTSVPAWDKLTAEEQDRFDQIMAIYAACVARMDQSVGELVEGLKQRGQFDNTLILFMSDNGGNAESGPNGRLKGDAPGDAASDVYCGESWALLQNTPFQQYKHFNHEGGIATPLVVHWPVGIAAHGELRQQPAHVIDVMATCVDVGRATYPQEFNGHAILPTEGRSLVPAFANKPIARDALYWEHEGNAAVRVEDWKLVRRGARGAWELYDLKSDRTEQQNRAAELPEKAKELAAKWQAWAVRCNVIEVKAPNAEQTNAKKKPGAKLTVAIGADAKMVDPFGVAFDSANNAYVVELEGGRLLKVRAAGHAQTIAGAIKQKGDAGDGGPASDARFNGLHCIAMAKSGDIYLADAWNRKVRKIDAKSGRISTIAGTGKEGYSGDGGTAASATFRGVYCVALTPKEDKLYLADLENRRIRAIDLSTGTIDLVAGNGSKGTPTDGAKATDAPLVDPRAVAADANGNVYILERGGHALRVVDRSGAIRTVVGEGGKAGNTGDGGDARAATLNGPKHLCIDRDGNVLIADTENHVIRKYSPTTGKIERVAGTGKRGGGIAADPLQIELDRPHGVTIHADGSLYISDSGNGRVLRLELPK